MSASDYKKIRRAALARFKQERIAARRVSALRKVKLGQGSSTPSQKRPTPAIDTNVLATRGVVSIGAIGGTLPEAYDDWKQPREERFQLIEAVMVADREIMTVPHPNSESHCARLSRTEVLKQILDNPSHYVQLVCEIGVVLCLFSLVLNWSLHVELLNDAFAGFLLVSLGSYWAMAWMKGKKDLKRDLKE